MLTPELRFSTARLGEALKDCLDWVIRRDRQQPLADPADEWVRIVASALQDVQIVLPPTVDPREPLLPCIETHVLKTEVFRVLASGMKGGPRLDVLLQIWVETELYASAFGVPIVIQRVPGTGLMPWAIWDELREFARKMIVATPSARIVLIGDGADFIWQTADDRIHHPVIVMTAHDFAGLKAPPRPVSGCPHQDFCADLASGWIGDPALSGRESSPVLDEVYCNFHFGQVLRIHLRQRWMDGSEK